jgi:hypothetical protein
LGGQFKDRDDFGHADLLRSQFCQAGSLALPTVDPISEVERVPPAGLHAQHEHVQAETRMS